MYDVAFLQVTRLEANDAQFWYEQKQSGLGRRFRAEIDTNLTRIQQNPFQFPLINGDIRKNLLTTFPYNLFFHIRIDKIFIIGCLHTSRKPMNWRKRIQ